jgi:TM2 domain-containing membrane protein YozV
MYRIIGADGREYGPVTAEQMRQWINEGRVNADTRVIADGGTEWRPLWMFTEFATTPPPPAPAPPPVPPPQYSPTPRAVEYKSKLAAGLLGILLGGWGVHRFYLGFTSIGVAQIIVTICTCGIGALWGFIEGILILTGSINTDARGLPLKD